MNRHIARLVDHLTRRSSGPARHVEQQQVTAPTAAPTGVGAPIDPTVNAIVADAAAKAVRAGELLRRGDVLERAMPGIGSHP